MNLSEYLAPEHVHLGLAATELAEVLREVLHGLPSGAEPPPERRDKFARDLAFGSVGDVVRLTTDVVAVLAPREHTKGTEVHVVVAAGPFSVTGEGRSRPSQARALVLILTSRRLARVRVQILPELTRYLKEGDHARRLLNATSPGDVLAMPGLMAMAFDEELRVATAMNPVSYRVYPDTPLHEVVDLMVRRELRALPVVGEDYELLGIVTAGDVLSDLLPSRTDSAEVEAGEPVVEGQTHTARDVMTRAVMCVSEEQPLLDAAALLVNREVGQLPVVREGELVGVLTREAVLRALFGR